MLDAKLLDTKRKGITAYDNIYCKSIHLASSLSVVSCYCVA